MQRSSGVGRQWVGHQDFDVVFFVLKGKGERALKEFLKSVVVAGDGLHPSKMAWVEVKKGADLAVSKKALSVVPWVVHQVVRLVQKAGQGVEALACGRVDRKINEPCSGINVKELGIGILFRCSRIVSVHHHQVGSRPPGWSALGAPVEGTSIYNCG